MAPWASSGAVDGPARVRGRARGREGTVMVQHAVIVSDARSGVLPRGEAVHRFFESPKRVLDEAALAAQRALGRRATAVTR